MLDTSVAIAHRPGPLFDPHDLPTIAGLADGARSAAGAGRGRTLQLHELPPQTRDALGTMLGDEPAQTPGWSEAAIVQLHWVLLAELKKLADPDTPLEEKIDTLDWALSPADEHIAFSFAACVRVVGTSPLSPTAYFGRMDVDELREWIFINARRWLRETLARYPQWAQELFYRDPQSAAARLSANPQWLNEQIRCREASLSSSCVQPDLFGRTDRLAGAAREASCATT
jgi:hypothetical protein